MATNSISFDSGLLIQPISESEIDLVGGGESLLYDIGYYAGVIVEKLCEGASAIKG